MPSPANHKLLSVWVLISAVVLLLVHAVVGATAPDWVGNFISNLATALLALSILELVFKTFLQEDLLGRLVTVFKNAINLPVKAVYLRRDDLPQDQTPLEIIKFAKEEVYIRGISFASLLAAGFTRDMQEIISAKGTPKVHFMILSPLFEDLDEVASLTNLSPSVLRETIIDFIRQLDNLELDNGQVDYVAYDTFPTVGLWLVDPDNDGGWCRIEVYLYHKEQQSSRVNIVVARRDAPAFFDRLVKAVRREVDPKQREKNGKYNRPVALLPEEAGGVVTLEKKGEERTLVRASAELDVDSWPAEVGSIVCLSVPTTNLTAINLFYAVHDSLIAQGIRGSDRIPPRTSTGILRIVSPRLPDKVFDIPLPRPTGFVYDFDRKRFLVACQGDNSIVEVGAGGIRQVLSHPLFNHLHSIDYYGGILAVACSGTDTVLVFDLEARREVYRWTATEHGYDKCPDGSVRKLDVGADHRFRLYPTLRQATHVNSAVLSRAEPEIVYASLFHQGCIVRLDMEKGSTEVALAGQDHPHGLKTDHNGGYVLTLASSGRVQLLDSEFRCTNSYFDSSVEWLQDACAVSKDRYLYTDVRNARLKMVDVGRKRIEGQYSFEREWKVYQVRSIDNTGWDEFSWVGDFLEL